MNIFQGSKKKLILILYSVFITSTSLYADPSVLSLTYNTVSQDVIALEFDEDMTITEWDPSHWKVYIGGVEVIGIFGPQIDPTDSKIILPSALAD